MTKTQQIPQTELKRQMVKCVDVVDQLISYHKMTVQDLKDLKKHLEHGIIESPQNLDKPMVRCLLSIQVHDWTDLSMYGTAYAVHQTLQNQHIIDKHQDLVNLFKLLQD